LLVDPLDPAAIAMAMRWILEHPSEAEEMGKRGRCAVAQIYNGDSEALKLKGLYKRLLNENNDSPMWLMDSSNALGK